MNRRIPPRQILYPGNLLKIFLGSIFPSKIDEEYFNEFFKKFLKSKEENTFIPVNKARVGIYLIYFETFTLTGEVHSEKKTITLVTQF